MFTTVESKKLVKEYPRSQRICEIDKIKKFVFWNYRYGTSGFRGNHTTLESVMIRMGLLAVLRSFSQNCQAVGIMVTASHNDECDNGVKIIDPSGEMMHHSWENLATTIANKSENDIIDYIQKQYDDCDDIKTNNDQFPTVFIGRDTRPHSKKFAQLVTIAANSVNTKVIIRDFAEITTPNLHYIVRRANCDIGIQNISSDIYLRDTLSAFKKLITILNDDMNNSNDNDLLLGSIIIDCANGVGGLPFKLVQQELINLININLIHLPSSKFKVNDNCGAEHVHKKRSLPSGLSSGVGVGALKNKKLASLDGDCDRLMYYYIDNNNSIQILDGDKQICLIFSFLQTFIDKCGVNLTTGVVQTAYANGSSTFYIANNLNIKSIITPTGVKHLHLEAKKYDISIYFEANGHGTVLISDNAVNKLKKELNDNVNINDEQKKAINVLLLLHSVSNQAIGDALADILLVEAALFGLKWDLIKWNSIYIDRPSCLTKLKVKDRNAFKTTNAEQTCVEPNGLQTAIDEILKKFVSSRSFVRPSGTEDVVRVYSEATTQDDADQINLLVRRAVYDIADGVGDRP